MKPSQQKISRISKKVSVVLKLGFIASMIVVMLALAGIGILVFSGEDTKSSFLAAFHVTANNGTMIRMEPRPLLLLFVFMLIDMVFISFAIFLAHAVFDEMKTGRTPFSYQNTVRIKKIAMIAAVLSIVGSCSDALVDYYTIGGLAWRVNIAGLMTALIIYCISLIFGYGCDLQQESDETL